MITVLKSSDNTQQKLQEILQRNQTEKNDIQQIVNDIVYDVKKMEMRHYSVIQRNLIK